MARGSRVAASPFWGGFNFPFAVRSLLADRALHFCRSHFMLIFQQKEPLSGNLTNTAS